MWSLLEPQSEPSPENGALSFASDVEDEALAQSVFVRNALVLLEEKEMDGKETMWISSSSNCLMKKCVSRLRDLISWPGLEATEHFRKGKTYREQDVGELHLLRLLVERAGLIRSAGLWFELTPLGRALLEPGRRGTLQALLFRHAFWDMDLSRFVRVHPRGLPGWWPQGEIGVILWGLSAVAEDWQNAAALTALCTIPDDELPETRRGPASTMFRVADSLAASLVRASRVPGARGDAGRGMAQERPCSTASCRSMSGYRTTEDRAIEGTGAFPGAARW